MDCLLPFLLKKRRHPRPMTPSNWGTIPNFCFFFPVENLITNVGQEPWISLKLPHLLSEIDGFRVIENQRRMIPLNNVTDPLCKDFMYDVIQIFQTAEPYLAKQLAIPPDQFPAFMHQLTQECQKEPPVHWSFVLCAAQKEMPTYE